MHKNKRIWKVNSRNQKHRIKILDTVPETIGIFQFRITLFSRMVLAKAECFNIYTFVMILRRIKKEISLIWWVNQKENSAKLYSTLKILIYTRLKNWILQMMDNA